MSEENGICGGKCDVFTFGLILYEILARKPVFDSEHETLVSVIRRLRTLDLPPIPTGSGEVMGELIAKCWQRDPATRPTFEDIWRLFEAHHFEILPGASATAIRHYCHSVLAWEQNPASPCP
jgi:hypothetical protein